MAELTQALKAGAYLKKLINKHYKSQDEFAVDYGTDIRTISRYVNNGINKVDKIQELADFFGVSFIDFFVDHS